MQIYTNGTHLYQAQAMTNVEFFMLDDDYQAENLTGLVVQEGYLVKYQDEQIQMTSWYPKAVFEKKFTLVDEFVNKILQHQSKNSWISIDDMLPESDSTDYLVYSIHTQVYEKVSVKNLRIMINNSSKITHWREAPQPPQE